jgi:tripartite-type tricarboxylate transporter receptor subunit TctC
MILTRAARRARPLKAEQQMKLSPSTRPLRAFAAGLLAFAAVTFSSTTPGEAQSQSYPNRRITFVVPYPPGGATDVSARLLAAKLSDAWKQSVVVENKSGGGGVVGNDYVAKSPPDGYTVLIAITQIIQAPSLVSNLP